MALGTYDELKQAIIDTLDRDDLTDYIDDFIDLAEARHKDGAVVLANGVRIVGVRIQQMLTRDSLTVDDRYVALPTGFLEAQVLRLLTSPVTTLRWVNLDTMSHLRQERSGKPSVYTTHETFEFDLAPDEAYSGEAIYYQELTPLSAVNQTNALLTRAPGAYLYASLAAAEPFFVNDERIGTWNSLYADIVAGLDASRTRMLKGGGPLIARVAGTVS